MRRAGQDGGTWRRAVVCAAPFGCLWAAACAPAATDEGVGRPAAFSRPAEQPPEAPRIVAFGDSLTAGLGLAPEEAYPARLQEHLDRAGHRLRVVNAGVSGDTTAGGLRRLPWALEGDVRILILALGGNDGLRGLPVEQMQDNLSRMIASAQQRGVRVLLAGMESPPNFGKAYTDAFRRVFERLAAEHDVDFLPFLLAGVAGVPALNQADGIHPNARGAERVAANVWSALEPLLGRATAGRPAGR